MTRRESARVIVPGINIPFNRQRIEAMDLLLNVAEGRRQNMGIDTFICVRQYIRDHAWLEEDDSEGSS